MKTFSEFFNLGRTQYELDFVDVPINQGDAALFIDPYAISKRSDRWSIQCHNLIVNFFQEAIDCIRTGKDAQAKRMLAGLREPNQTRLGLSSGKLPRGRGVGGEQAIDLYNALSTSTAVRTGFITDLEDCELLIEGIGPDKISDITTNIIRGKLIEYTQHTCELLGVPTHPVASGLIWDSGVKKWASRYENLPVCNGASVILVPKAIVRYRLEFNHQEYYQHFVLNFLQIEHLQANSSLVRTLKDGTKKEPTKKSLKELSPISKKFLYDFTKEHPEVLQSYKRNKVLRRGELSNEELIEVLGARSDFSYQKLHDKLLTIPVGDSGASKFHEHMIGVLTAIFYPDLSNPEKERPIHDGRKRVDIFFENSACDGFFLALAQIKRVPCAYVMVECKNYKADPANPELDQLAGRFSVNRGQFGFLVCRSIVNKKLFARRCKDTAGDGRGYIIALDDEDILQLLSLRVNKDSAGINRFLDERFRGLVV